jgi:hypothetical protein
MTPVGLPHSGIHGSKPAYDSPWHFAVNRALLRLLAPRHPPYALSSLTYFLLLPGSSQNFRFEVAALGRPVLRGISDIVSVKSFRLFTRFTSLCSFQRTTFPVQSCLSEFPGSLALLSKSLRISNFVPRTRKNGGG